MHLSAIDWAIMAAYFVVVLGIGFALARRTKTSGEFFLAGRSLPVWVTAFAFISANLGAQEVIGMGASGAKYGIATAHFYWIGAIPAMVFIGLFMMPFYYGSKARSVPEYLKLRFDEKTRTLNALSFAVMTIFSSGISMYAMARLLQALHVFDDLFNSMQIPTHFIFDFSVAASALIVLLYILMGGLRSAVYNEVLQFALICAGFVPLVVIGLRNTGGWSGIVHTLPSAYTHAWHGMGNAHSNLLGVDAFGLVMGLGFVLSFGYWCTDYLVVQRAMAANDLHAARLTPLVAAIPKMLFPFVVILPGIIAVALTPGAFGDPGGHAAGLIPVQGVNSAGQPIYDYNMAVPMLLLHYFPAGLLGLGLTALLASFMSGMAGNVTAFNTVWTYDIYQSHIKRDGSDAHYLTVGRLTTIFGIAASMIAAYVAAQFNNIMDVLQLVFAFVNAPVFATFLLGMFWKRTTGHGAFIGLLSGIGAAALHQALTLPLGSSPGIKGGWITVLHTYPSEMAQNFYTAIFAWSTCFIVTIVVSLLTRPRPEAELEGLVYSLTPKPKDSIAPWYAKPAVLAGLVLAGCVILNVLFR
jgi:SSS family solute:Na+ symporter